MIKDLDEPESIKHLASLSHTGKEIKGSSDLAVSRFERYTWFPRPLNIKNCHHRQILWALFYLIDMKPFTPKTIEVM